MLFYILTAVAGLMLIFGTLLGVRILSERFQLSRKIFWKAGFLFLILEIFYLAVLGNITSIWPALDSLVLWQKATILGLITALFFELGRFVVLDKFMPSIRSFKEGVFFGFGWGGVEAFFLGILMLLSIAGMHMLATTQNLPTAFPNASSEEIKQIQEYQQQVSELLKGSPVVGLIPLLERAAQIMLDIALSLLLILGFQKGQNKYVLYTIMMRAIITALLIIATGTFGMWGEGGFIIVGLLSFALIHKIKKEFKHKNYFNVRK